jgi:hypothetical protein
MIIVPISPTLDGPKRVQSFGLRFRLSGWCGASQIWSETVTAGVIVLHRQNASDPPWRVGVLPLVPGAGMDMTSQTIPGTSVTVQLGAVNTAGAIHVVEVDEAPPGLVARPGVLPRHWYIVGAFDDEPIQTEIVALELSGDSAWLGPAGITTPTLMAASRQPDFPAESFFDVFYELEPVPGSTTKVLPGRVSTIVPSPDGFTIWGVGMPAAVPVDVSRFALH